MKLLKYGRFAGFRANKTGLLVAVVASALFPASSFALALFNDTFGLPAGLANDVVRINEQFNNQSFVGSGTVISVVPDGSGGDWYNVLTADHVIFGAVNAVNNGNAGSITMGFNTDQTFPLFVASTANTALDGANNGPDLGLFSIDVSAATLGNLPANVLGPSAFLPVSIIAPNNAANNQIVQAGYGNQATVGFGAPAANGTARYLVNQGFGTYNAGANTIPANGLVNGYVGVGNGRGGNYTFNAIRGSTAFTINNGTITTGTTYIMGGDSGGPTFESNGSGGLALVGVHSDSESFNANTANEYVTSGLLWSDVQVSSYTAWINQQIPLIDTPTPEPGSIAILALGTAGLALRRFVGRRS